MIRKIKLLLLIGMLFHFTSPEILYAQQNNADSLISLLQANIARHEAVQMEENSMHLLRLSEQNNDNKNRIEALKFMGIAQHLQARYDSAVIWYQQALALSINQNDTLNIAKCYLNIATSYNTKGDFEMAVKNALSASEFFEQINDVNGQGRVQNLLGIFYFNRNDFKGALGFFEKYQELAIASGDSGEIVSSYNNTAAALHALNRYTEERQLLRKSIAIQEAREQHIRIGSAYENLGTLYIDTDSLDRASYYLEKARTAFLANNNTYDLARLLLQSARLKKNQQNSASAIKDIEKALEYCETGGYLQLKQDALQQLALVYEELGNYRNAYLTYLDYVSAKDSILNEKNQESINQLMIEFETEKKERQIVQQNLEISEQSLKNRRKSSVIIFLLGTIVIVLLLAFIVYSRFKIKQERKLNTERAQMQQSQLRAVLESQESERKRFARDLHDGFGQLITAVKIMLGQLQTSNEPEEKNEIAHKSNEVLDSMHNQLREIAHNLMPEQLSEEGLIAALKDYARRLSTNTTIDVQVNSFAMEDRLNYNVEINVYRIIQEWMNNVIKYSGAHKINLQITGFDKEVNVLIEDDGKGFQKEKLTNSEGWGWKNIQSRLETIKGNIEIDTNEGTNGTSFILDFPKQ